MAAAENAAILAAQALAAAPYCGPAPSPAELIGRWNPDPLILVPLAALGLFLVLRPPEGPQRRLAAFAGLAALVAAFVSPLCAASTALFSARVVHHALVVAVAAPLLVMAFAPSRGPRPPLVLATVLQTVLMWLWHAPGPYAFALSGDAAYWLMELSLFGAAGLFWLSVRRSGAVAGCAALLVSMAQMGLLGALITLSPEPLFEPHLATTAAFGLTPLGDQQAAGLIMWAPMAGFYMVAGLAILWRELGAEPAAA